MRLLIILCIAAGLGLAACKSTKRDGNAGANSQSEEKQRQLGY